MGGRMKQFIVITGEAESGKDTVARYLAEYFEEEGERVIITHYADLLKYTCESFFGWDGKKDMYGRSLLQRVGTEYVRDQLSKSFWIDYVWNMLDFSKDRWDTVIIADARYDNEIDVKPRAKKIDADASVKTIKVARNKKSSLSDEQKKHSSESGVNNIDTDYVINNNGDLHRLREEARVIATKIDEIKNDKVYPGDVIKYKDGGTDHYAIVLEAEMHPNMISVLSLDCESFMIFKENKEDRMEVIGSVSEELNDMLSMAKLISKK